MAWHTTHDLDEFEAAAGSFLLADPLRHTLPLTVLATVRRRGPAAYGAAPPWFGWYQEPGKPVGGAALQTPPHPVIVTDLADGAAVGPLAALAADAPALSGPAPAVTAVADSWRAATGRDTAVLTRQRLYRLDEPTPPSPLPAGRARPASSADRKLLIGWYEAFGRDTGTPVAGGVEPVVDERIAAGGLTVWEVEGEPVSMAGATVPVGGMVRVAPVYTPAALRGKGFAGAVTAAVGEAALAAGNVVCLFTDLANPTSNALYQRIGYRPVGDWAIIRLRASA